MSREIRGNIHPFSRAMRCSGRPRDCKELKQLAPNAPDGVYAIDPDGYGGEPPFDVRCDMTTANGGWTVVWYVDADHFDGTYANDYAPNLSPPTTLNSQRDIWNVPQSIAFGETLFGCTMQNDVGPYFWRYDSAAPYDYFANTTTSHNYVNTASAESNGGQGGCLSTHEAAQGHGFMVIQTSSCGNCSTIRYGMYHYVSGGGCNSTSTTYAKHSSPWDNRSIEYPICNGAQTSNGRFWIAVR